VEVVRIFFFTLTVIRCAKTLEKYCLFTGWN